MLFVGHELQQAIMPLSTIDTTFGMGPLIRRSGQYKGLAIRVRVSDAPLRTLPYSGLSE